MGPAGTARGLKIPTLRRVVTAGAPASPRVLDEFARLLEPPAEIFTPYGATEALPVASIGSNEILEETRYATERGEGVCVGRPVEGIDVRIIRIIDEPIPAWSDDLELSDGTVGEIIVAGPVVTREYFGRPEATALAKIADRSAVRSSIGWATWATAMTAADSGSAAASRTGSILARHDPLSRSAARVSSTPIPTWRARPWSVCGTKESTIPVLCVEPLRPLDRRRPQSVSRTSCSSAGPLSRTQAGSRRSCSIHPFPVDIRHNSKIFREKLAVWAKRKLR